jgi:DNA-binding IclR family transcriptional regulator
MLVEVARTPDATVRDLADRAGLTERQAHRVLGDLVEGGYVERERVGRRNRYRVNERAPMRHPSVATHHVGELLQALAGR